MPHVEELAQHYHAKVVFMQVVEWDQAKIDPYISSLDLFQKLVELQENQAESYLAGLKGEFREKNIKACSRVIRGAIVETIINAAECEDADIIALASRGRNGLPKALYGSVAAGVLHHADLPLLIIRSRGLSNKGRSENAI